MDSIERLKSDEKAFNVGLKVVLFFMLCLWMKKDFKNNAD